MEKFSGGGVSRTMSELPLTRTMSKLEWKNFLFFWGGGIPDNVLVTQNPKNYKVEKKKFNGGGVYHTN